MQARVTGLASELDENLELTSEPARSEAEIVALIGEAKKEGCFN